MSSWLVSLRWVGGGVTRACRCLEEYGLGAARFGNGFFNAGPGRLVAEASAQVVQQDCDLSVGHAGGKARHDRAGLALHGTNARQHDVSEIARIGSGDRGRETEIDPTKGRRPAGLMAGGASR